jgi:hypothetical protein
MTNKPALHQGTIMNELASTGIDCSYDTSCLIAIGFGVALILGLAFIAAFFFPEEKE